MKTSWLLKSDVKDPAHPTGPSHSALAEVRTSSSSREVPRSIVLCERAGNVLYFGSHELVGLKMTMWTGRLDST